MSDLTWCSSSGGCCHIPPLLFRSRSCSSSPQANWLTLLWLCGMSLGLGPLVDTGRSLLRSPCHTHGCRAHPTDRLLELRHAIAGPGARFREGQREAIDAVVADRHGSSSCRDPGGASRPC